MVSHPPLPYRQSRAAATSSSSGSTLLAPSMRQMPCGFGVMSMRRPTDIADADNPPKDSKVTIIYAELLIPGDGIPIENVALITSEKSIVYVGKKIGLPKKYFRHGFEEHHVHTVMPGFWNAHIHMAGVDNFYNDYTAFLSTHAASAGARLARDCWESLQKGYTSMRDLGGYGCEVAKAVNDGSIVGPNIYGADAYISQTGGHGDVHGLPIGDVYENFGVAHPHAGQYAGPLCVADGMEEVRRAVRLQIRRGAKVIKVIVSGGIRSRDDNPKYSQYSPEELRVIVGAYFFGYL